MYISVGCIKAIYGLRPYGGSLLSNSHKSKQKGLATTYGLRCALVPSLRSRSVGTPKRAIHGPSRLSRHPCRSTHCAKPPLGLPKSRDRSRSTAWIAAHTKCVARRYNCALDPKIIPVATRLCRRLKGPSQQAERRRCYGGRPAWMPGELRRALDGPSQRAAITVPE